MTIFFVFFLFALFSLFILASDIAAFFDARLKAEDGADAAVLAAVSEAFPLSSTGKDPEAVARKVAKMNRCEVKNVRISESLDKATVTVVISPKLMVASRIATGNAVVVTSSAEIDYEALIAGGYLLDVFYRAGLSFQKIPSFCEISKGNFHSGTSAALLALHQIGKPYVWGSEGPFSFDCSGLVYYVYRALGVRLPRVSYAQAKCGIAIMPSQLAPGDLVFFRGNAHVGIYIGAGCFVHAPHRGDVVRISSLTGRRLSACRRIFINN